MQENGKVVEILKEGRYAKVRFERRSACANCGMCMFKKEDAHVDMTVENTLHAEVGDTALVEMRDNVVLLSALIAYLLPVLFAAVGLIVGIFLKNELIQLCLCLSFLILGYIIIIALDKKCKLTRKMKPVMLRLGGEELPKQEL